MVDKDDLRTFCRFLDQASDAELRQRLSDYCTIIELLPSGSDARRDYQFLKRKLIDEQVARLQVRMLEQARKDRQA